MINEIKQIDGYDALTAAQANPIHANRVEDSGQPINAPRPGLR